MGLFYTAYYAGMAVLPPAAGWLQDMAGRAAAVHFAAAAIFCTLLSYLVFRMAAETAAKVRREPTRQDPS